MMSYSISLIRIWASFLTPEKAKQLSKLNPGLPGPKKIKRPNLAISSFKKGQILKNEKKPNKGQIYLKKLLK
jgi:hypothetical protein